MKIIFYRLFVLFLLVLGTLPAIAVNKVDGIYYNLDGIYKSCSVTSGNVKYSGEVVIPSEITYSGDIYDVTSIGWSAFSGCTGLTTVTIKDGTSTLKMGYNSYSINFLDDDFTVEALFHDCPLKTVYLGRTLSYDIYISSYHFTLSDYSPFRGQSTLTSVTIGKSVDEVGEKAFYDCTGLTSVTCYAEEPPTAGGYCFEFIPDDAVLYVPTGTTEKYKSANQWSRFFKIEEVDPNTAIRDVRIDQQSGHTTIFDLYGHNLAQPRRGVNIINGKKVLVK